MANSKRERMIGELAEAAGQASKALATLRRCEYEPWGLLCADEEPDETHCAFCGQEVTFLRLNFDPQAFPYASRTVPRAFCKRAADLKLATKGER